MARWFATIVAVITLALNGTAKDRPHISLALPSGVASETVQIQYFLIGPFGGYGSFVRPEKEKASYEIDPFVGDQAAAKVKIIAYLPGCEIDTFDFTFSGASVERRLDCNVPGSVLLRGKVLPSSMTLKQNEEIEVSYLAEWAYGFFGIQDGFVTTFNLGTVRPHPDGTFEMELPDFYKLGGAEIQFIVRDSKTWNIIAFLKPEDDPPNSLGLVTVQASYPLIRLVAEHQNEQRGK